MYVFYIIFGLFFAVMFCGVRFLSLNIFGKSVCRIKNAEKNTVYLTFDDGPNPDITPSVLELLEKYKQKATFFCIAEKARKNRDTVKKIIEAGHTIGSHDLYHRPTDNFRRTRQMTQEIGESARILEEISGLQIKFYRPPVGLSNPHLFVALKRLNLQCAGWSKSARDGKNRILSAIKNIPKLANAKDGDIILLHDDSPVKNKKIFLENLEKLLSNLEKAGKRSKGIF